MDSPSTKPTRIGPYDIVEVIGRGGMGTVYRCNDPRIGRAVAIKVLTAAADDPDLLTRFHREAQYTGNLHHPNIVTIYELGQQETVPYLVMEYLEGVSLEATIASGRAMPIAEKLAIILQVCNGLAYAHQRGIVHRDIKPANVVVLADGTAKIVDFGIALLGGSKLTRTGYIVGSLNYMSPEQLGGTEVDARTDVYSTAVVLFQMLTGNLPFDGGSTAATLRKIMQDPPPPLATYMKDCPDELEGILQKALAKNRDERYPTAEEFSLDLSRVHLQYQSKMLSETLQQAADSLQRKDFTAARQFVLRVLRYAPQNVDATDLFRLIKLGQDQQQREQNILQLQMKAEEAFRKNQLEEARQFSEQGMQLDPSNTVFPSIQSAIRETQSRMTKYRESLKHAEEELRAGNLERAKELVVEAQSVLPDDDAARTLVGQVIARLEQQLRDRNDAARQSGEADHSSDSFDLQTMEMPAPSLPRPPAAKSGDTNHQKLDVQQPAAAEINVPDFRRAPPAPNESAQRPVPAVEMPRDALFPKPAADSKSDEVAPELREFLEPQKRFPRSIIWMGAVLVLALAAFLWWRAQPKSATTATAPSSQPAVVAPTITYAEINAEPWATVTAVTPANGDAQSIIGQATPLRVNLPPGDYSVTLQGPNHETKQVEITVPQQGGATCFAVFHKPDLNRLVGSN